MSLRYLTVFDITRWGSHRPLFHTNRVVLHRYASDIIVHHPCPCKASREGNNNNNMTCSTSLLHMRTPLSVPLGVIGKPTRVLLCNNNNNDDEINNININALDTAISEVLGSPPHKLPLPYIVSVLSDDIRDILGEMGGLRGYVESRDTVYRIWQSQPNNNNNTRVWWVGLVTPPTAVINSTNSNPSFDKNNKNDNNKTENKHNSSNETSTDNTISLQSKTGSNKKKTENNNNNKPFRDFAPPPAPKQQFSKGSSELNEKDVKRDINNNKDPSRFYWERPPQNTAASPKGNDGLTIRMAVRWLDGVFLNRIVVNNSNSSSNNNTDNINKDNMDQIPIHIMALIRLLQVKKIKDDIINIVAIRKTFNVTNNNNNSSRIMDGCDNVLYGSDIYEFVASVPGPIGQGRHGRETGDTLDACNNNINNNNKIIINNNSNIFNNIDWSKVHQLFEEYVVFGGLNVEYGHFGNVHNNNNKENNNNAYLPQEYDILRVARFVSATEVYTPLGELVQLARHVVPALNNLSNSSPDSSNFPATNNINNNNNESSIILLQILLSAPDLFQLDIPFNPTAVRFIGIKDHHIPTEMLSSTYEELHERRTSLQQEKIPNSQNYKRIQSRRQTELISIALEIKSTGVISSCHPAVLAYYLFDSLPDKMIPSQFVGKCLPPNVTTKTRPSFIPFLKAYPYLFRVYEMNASAGSFGVLRADAEGAPPLPEERNISEQDIIDYIKELILGGSSSNNMNLTSVMNRTPFFIKGAVFERFRQKGCELCTSKDRNFRVFLINKPQHFSVSFSGDREYISVLNNGEQVGCFRGE